MKIGRNDPCSCNSGKKYKKCCIDKPHMLPVGDSHPFHNLYTYEKVDEWSTDDIIQRLKDMNIPFDKETFLEDVERYNSADDLSENWFASYDVQAEGLDEDVPWFAAWVLWERLAPEGVFCNEQLGDLIEAGYAYMDENDDGRASDVWLELWEGLKKRMKPVFVTMDYLEDDYTFEISFRSVLQDLEMVLHNAGMRDKTYFEKRITFCREFCRYFPGEDEEIIHNMGRAIAASYGYLGDKDNVVAEFMKLIEDYPENPWGYIGWGDVYMKDDPARARELYEKALTIATDEEDIETIQARLVSV